MVNSLAEKILIIATTLILFFVLLFIYTKIVGPIPFSVNSITTTKSDTFSVSGEGKAFIKPDSALVSLGVQANAQTAKLAQEEMNRNINAVKEAIKTLGVADSDIKTENYNVYPVMDYREGAGERITGYNANTNLSIKVKNIDKVNQIVDSATLAGANQVGGVTFDVEDRTKAENEARAKAVEEAKKKAIEAAKIAGFSLGRIINYSESFGGVPPGVFPVAAEKSGMGGGGGTEIEPGSSEIRLTVTLSFEIR